MSPSTVGGVVRRSLAGTVLAGFVLASFGFLHASSAEAAEYNPGNTEELIEAINDANGNNEADVINLVPDATYTLNGRDNNDLGINGLPVISTEVEINGNGATIERGDRAPDFRILAIGQTGPIQLNPPRIEVTLRDLTMSGGRGASLGGAILNADSNLTITGCTITDNSSSQFGGGVYSDTQVVQLQSSTTIINSTITNNSTTLAGGGVHNDGGSLEISSSTITRNTISSVGNGGGGVSNASFTETNLTSNIIVDNRAGTRQDDVGGSAGSSQTYESGGYNLVGAGSRAGDFTSPGDQRGVSVTQAFGIGSPALADNGGPTETVALTPGSFAIDNVPADTDGVPETDQRGVERPQFAGSDTGSFEYDDEAPRIVISELVLPDATVGERYFKRLSASGSGGEYTFATRGETLPPGFTLSRDGRISGTPRNAGRFTFVVEARDASGFTGEREFTLTVNAPPENSNACTIAGTSGSDRLSGTSGRDVICGFGGNDAIYGLGGDDLIRGGSGNDAIRGGAGNDRTYGETGTDAIFGGAGRDRLFGEASNDYLKGGPGSDRLDGGPGRNVERQK